MIQKFKAEVGLSVCWAGRGAKFMAASRAVINVLLKAGNWGVGACFMFCFLQMLCKFLCMFIKHCDKIAV